MPEISEETPSLPEASHDVEAEPEDAVLPLAELDRLLAPLRRTLAWAVRDGEAHAGDVRYLEANAGPALDEALALDLPAPIRELLDTLNDRLAGFDEADLDLRRARLGELYQGLARLDAVLGLPLAPARAKRVRRDLPVGEQLRGDGEAQEAAEPPTGRRKKRKRSRRRKEREEEQPPEAAPTAAPEEQPHHLGDTDKTGRPLAELGVAPAVCDVLAERGVRTLLDLFLLPPRGEEVIRPVHGAGREIPEGRVAVGGRVRARRTRLLPGGRRFTEVLLVGAGPLWVRWEGTPPAWVLDRLVPDSRAVLVGRLAEDVLEDPELAQDPGTHAVHLATYGVDGVDDRVLRGEIERLLPLAEGLADPLPDAVREANELLPLSEAILQAHRAVSARPDARRRLAFDEALTSFLGLARPRFKAARERGIPQTVLHGLAARMRQFHELELSDAQQRALEDVKRDLRRQAPMLRLLTGEVGIGRGLVWTTAAVIVAENKSQVLVLAPDPVAAEMRYLFTEPLLRDLGLVGRLVESRPSAAQRDAIRRGEVHVVFGTTDLLDAELDYRRLGLVVSEEAGSWGSTARRVAKLRAPRPHTLVFTTTPVPASSLLTGYADHEISVLETWDRRDVACRLFQADERMAAYELAAERIRQGEQVYVLFPLVRGLDALDGREATRVQATLEERVFPGARVGLFHGAMSREERYRVYHDFRNHRFDVLVATTYVEDGPPVLDAVVAIVEQADRLGWDRAHRIRGHVTRGRQEAECYFILGDQPDTAGIERLERLIDGGAGIDELAEEPIEADYRWLQPRHDRPLLLAAQRLALATLAEDAGLRSGANPDLARAARVLWPKLFDKPVPVPDPKPSGGGRRRRKRRRNR